MATVSYYDVLGVSKFASTAEIREQYKKLALRYHPDKSGEDTKAHFQKIQNAYQTLSDPGARSSYDYGIRRERQRTSAASKPEPQSQQKPQGQPKHTDTHHSDWTGQERFEEWYEKVHNRERFPFSGSVGKVEHFKRQSQAFIDNWKAYFYQSMEWQRSKYEGFVLDAQFRAQKAKMEWRELCKHLDTDRSRDSPAFNTAEWSQHMKDLVTTQRERQQEASTVIFAHAEALETKVKKRKEKVQKQQKVMDAGQVTTRRLLRSSNSRYEFDEYCDQQRFKLMQLVSISEAEEQTFIVKKITELRAVQLEFEEVLATRQGEFQAKLDGDA